ncbi:MAG: PorT family protein [Tannerella sp.]|jgi:hypothetical protein|nr:PorT family protein [Tannerella sp.]
MKKEKGKFEETVRSKLYNFESNTNADDWDRILAKLPEVKTVKPFPLKKYLTLAAAIAVLTALVGGLYYYNYDSRITNYEANNNNDKGMKAQTGKETKAQTGKGTKAQTGKNTKAQTNEIAKAQKQQLPTPNSQLLIPDSKLLTLHSKLYTLNSKLPPRPSMLRSKSIRRRWGFGVGGGRLGISSNPNGFLSDGLFTSSINYTYTDHAAIPSGTPNGEITNNEIITLYSKNIPHTSDIKHKMPISFGLGASYYLNDRWTLQSGLVYTMLRSEWLINNIETYEYSQKLHYIGVPLALSYKLGQWKQLGFYASAGGMIEYNIAGNLKTTTFSNNDKFTKNTGVKMKEPLFSVNSKVRAIYPVWRYINIYAETGMSYYFDNGSYLKTIRSDKPFNVSLQAGISFGF